MRLELLRDAIAVARLPEVLGERCVHSLVEHATCRRCVDSCPTAAWVIDDERLGIDPARCDGCGLCAPACPQAAIVARTVEPLRVGSPGRSSLPGATESAALIACDRAFPGRSGFPAATAHRARNGAPTSPASASEPGTSPSEPGRSGFPAAIPHRGLDGAPTSTPDGGIVPCIHALGLRDLARLAAAGCRRLIVATGDCDACPRGDRVRLQSRLADLARLLDSRGLPILRLERLPPHRWQSARGTATPDAGPAIGRRSFLRRGLGLAVDQAANAFGLAAAERQGIDTVTRLLPDTGRPQALAPAVPRIDPAACTGCDACVRLCPQRAIRLEREGSGPEDPIRDGAAAVGSGSPMSGGPAAAVAGRSGLGTAGRAEADAAAEPAPLAYRVLPDACTGCGICVDVCADRAVRLEQWLPARPTVLPLHEAACARCRVRFHRPVIAAAGPALCPICARRGGAADRLFRLQE